MAYSPQSVAIEPEQDDCQQPGQDCRPKRSQRWKELVHTPHGGQYIASDAEEQQIPFGIRSPVFAGFRV